MEYIDFEWWPSCPPPPPPCLLRPPPPPRSPPPGLLRFDLLDPPPDFEGGAGAWGRFGIVVVMLVEGDLEVVVKCQLTKGEIVREGTKMANKRKGKLLIKI